MSIPIRFVPNPYPIGAFPHSIHNAIVEVLHHTHAPEALVASSFLSALSVACQGEVDVKLPTCRTRPVSLNTLVVADSGERKSTVDELVAAPIYAYDKAKEDQYKHAEKKFDLDKAVWDAVQKGLLRKLSAAAAVNANADD